MPDSVWELLCWCWERQPSDRPDAQVVAQHASDRFLRKQELWETPKAARFLDKVFYQCDGLSNVYEGASLLLKNLLRGRYASVPLLRIFALT